MESRTWLAHGNLNLLVLTFEQFYVALRRSSTDTDPARMKNRTQTVTADGAFVSKIGLNICQASTFGFLLVYHNLVSPGRRSTGGLGIRL
jgi:hypothetical protein